MMRPRIAVSDRRGLLGALELATECIADVERVDHPIRVGGDLRQVHVEVHLRQRARDVVQQPHAIGRADLDHREEVRRGVVHRDRHRRVAPLRVVAPLLGHAMLQRHPPVDRLAQTDPGTPATAPPPRRARTRPWTSNRSAAAPSSVVNTCAVRIENPASESAPAIHDSKPGRSAATTNSW